MDVATDGDAGKVSRRTRARKKLEAKDVLPNVNRTQAAERAENAVFVPGDF